MRPPKRYRLAAALLLFLPLGLLLVIRPFDQSLGHGVSPSRLRMCHRGAASLTRPDVRFSTAGA